MHSIGGRGRLCLVALVVVVVAAMAGSASAAPAARAAQVCTPPAYPGLGYFISLSVSRVSCAKGERVARGYYRCRVRHGKAGRCHRRVLGFRCRERRRSIETQISAKVTCTRGGASVVHVYQQDL